MDERNEASGGKGQDGISELVSGILSNPDMMSMISSIAKEMRMSPKESENEPTAEAESLATNSADALISPSERKEESPDISALLSKLAPLLSYSNDGKNDDDRACLLRALKPYLSRSRSDAVDYIIRFSGVAKMLRKLS